MHWAKILLDIKKTSQIRELHLRHLPVLKTCEKWSLVNEVGMVQHETKYGKYEGMIIEYNQQIYFLDKSYIKALSPYRSWKTDRKIKVIESTAITQIANTSATSKVPVRNKKQEIRDKRRELRKNKQNARVPQPKIL